MPAIKFQIGEQQIESVVGHGESLFSLSNSKTLDPIVEQGIVKNIIIKPEGKLEYMMDDGAAWSRADKLLFASRDEAVAYWVESLKVIIGEKSQGLLQPD